MRQQKSRTENIALILAFAPTPLNGKEHIVRRELQKGKARELSRARKNLEGKRSEHFKEMFRNWIAA